MPLPTDGNAAAQTLERLTAAVRLELLRLAPGRFGTDTSESALRYSALVREAYDRLARAGQVGWRDRASFYSLVARLTRSILVDLERAHPGPVPSGLDVLALDRALTALAELDAQQSLLMELRFFAGLPIEEAAELLEIPVATANRDWVSGKAWLSRQMIGRSRHAS